MLMNTLQKIENIEELILPSMIGNKLIKRIVATQMFTNPLAGEKLHIMIVGNVASGKSTLGLEVLDILPNSSYCGKKTTPVGLIEKLISSNGSILIFDELDKVDKEVREQLLECMQSGHISYDKFQYHRRHQAKVNILALCNPKGYTLSEDMNLLSQVNFGLPLLSRFHMVLPIYQIDPSYYPEIAVKMLTKQQDDERKEKLRRYITAVKKQIPYIEIDENITRNVGVYIEELKLSSPMSEIISPRAIEGMISFIKANARMNLKTKADMEDFTEVKNIYDKIFY